MIFIKQKQLFNHAEYPSSTALLVLLVSFSILKAANPIGQSAHLDSCFSYPLFLVIASNNKYTPCQRL